MSVVVGVAARWTKRVEIDERPRERRDGERDPGVAIRRPSDRPAIPGRRARPFGRATLGRATEKRDDEGQQQKADAIDVRLDDADDPVERVRGEARTPGRR